MVYKTILLILILSIVSQAQIMLNPKRSDILNPPVAGGVTPFYTMDFEEGDGSDLTSVGANTTFGENAHSGSYGMEITSSSSTVNYYTFASAKDEVWVTFWIFVPDGTTFSGAAYSYSSWFYDGSTTTTLSIFGGHAEDVSGDYKWRVWMMGSYDATFADNSTNFTRDEWHKIKVYYKKGTGANSVHKFWVDDDLALSVTDGNRTGNTEGYSICIYQPSATSGSIYWDDFKFYNEDPGTQD